MYVEMQLSADVFTRMVRNRLKAVPIALDLSLPGVDGSTLVVDQVLIGDATTLQRERALDAAGDAVPASTQVVWSFSPRNLFSFTVPFVQVRQDVSIVLVRERDLEDNGVRPSPPARTFSLAVVFDVAVKVDNPTQGGGPATMTYSLAYVDFGAGPDAVPVPARPMVNQVVAGIHVAPTTVDFGALSGLMGKPVSAINAGIACDPGTSRVAIRADIDVLGTPVSIDPVFFEQGPQDLLAGQQWAMLVDQAVLVSEAERRVRTSLARRASMRLLSGPVARWDAAETTLRTTADLRLLGVCPNFVDDTDIDLRATIASRWSLAPTPPNTLVTNHHLGHAKTDPGQVFACAVTGALLFPIMGTALFVTDPDFSLADFVGGIAFAPFVAVANLMGYINSRKLTDDISGSLGETCRKLDDDNYQCTTSAPMVVQLSPGRNSTLAIERVFGVLQGLALSGPVQNLPEGDDGEIGDIEVSPFAWQILGRCTGNGRNDFTVGNQARIRVPVSPPASLAVVRLLPPSTGYSVSVSGEDIVVTPTDPPPPHPCRIRIVTGRGVRTLTLDPAGPLTADRAAELERERIAAVAGCYYDERHFTQVERIGWLVDPPHRELTDPVALWQILVRGAVETDTLTVVDPAGEVLARARPAASGTIHLSLMFGADTPTALTLELERPEGQPARELQVATHQIVYEQRGALPVAADVRELRLGGTSHAPELTVESTGRFLTWDITSTSTPVLTSAVSAEARPEPQDRPDLEGELVRHPKVLGFGETLAVLDGDEVRVFDVSDASHPVPVQTLATRAWMEVGAANLTAMARVDRTTETVHLHAVVGTSDRGGSPGQR